MHPNRTAELSLPRLVVLAALLLLLLVIFLIAALVAESSPAATVVQRTTSHEFTDAIKQWNGITSARTSSTISAMLDLHVVQQRIAPLPTAITTTVTQTSPATMATITTTTAAPSPTTTTNISSSVSTTSTSAAPTSATTPSPGTTTSQAPGTSTGTTVTSSGIVTTPSHRRLWSSGYAPAPANLTDQQTGRVWGSVAIEPTSTNSTLVVEPSDLPEGADNYLSSSLQWNDVHSEINLHVSISLQNPMTGADRTRLYNFASDSPIGFQCINERDSLLQPQCTVVLDHIPLLTSSSHASSQTDCLSVGGFFSSGQCYQYLQPSVMCFQYDFSDDSGYARADWCPPEYQQLNKLQTAQVQADFASGHKVAFNYTIIIRDVHDPLLKLPVLASLCLPRVPNGCWNIQLIAVGNSHGVSAAAGYILLLYCLSVAFSFLLCRRKISNAPVAPIEGHVEIDLKQQPLASPGSVPITQQSKSAKSDAGLSLAPPASLASAIIPVEPPIPKGANPAEGEAVESGDPIVTAASHAIPVAAVDPPATIAAASDADVPIEPKQSKRRNLEDYLKNVENAEAAPVDEVQLVLDSLKSDLIDEINELKAMASSATDPEERKELLDAAMKVEEELLSEDIAVAQEKGMEALISNAALYDELKEQLGEASTEEAKKELLLEAEIKALEGAAKATSDEVESKQLTDAANLLQEELKLHTRVAEESLRQEEERESKKAALEAESSARDQGKEAIDKQTALKEQLAARLAAAANEQERQRVQLETEIEALRQAASEASSEEQARQLEEAANHIEDVLAREKATDDRAKRFEEERQRKKLELEARLAKRTKGDPADTGTSPSVEPDSILPPKIVSDSSGVTDEIKRRRLELEAQLDSLRARLATESDSMNQAELEANIHGLEKGMVLTYSDPTDLAADRKKKRLELEAKLEARSRGTKELDKRPDLQRELADKQALAASETERQRLQIEAELRALQEAAESAVDEDQRAQLEASAKLLAEALLRGGAPDLDAERLRKRLEFENRLKARKQGEMALNSNDKLKKQLADRQAAAGSEQERQRLQLEAEMQALQEAAAKAGAAGDAKALEQDAAALEAALMSDKAVAPDLDAERLRKRLEFENRLKARKQGEIALNSNDKLKKQLADRQAAAGTEVERQRLQLEAEMQALQEAAAKAGAGDDAKALEENARTLEAALISDKAGADGRDGKLSDARRQKQKELEAKLEAKRNKAVAPLSMEELDARARLQEREQSMAQTILEMQAEIEALHDAASDATSEDDAAELQKTANDLESSLADDLLERDTDTKEVKEEKLKKLGMRAHYRDQAIELLSRKASRLQKKRDVQAKLQARKQELDEKKIRAAAILAESEGLVAKEELEAEIAVEMKARAKGEGRAAVDLESERDAKKRKLEMRLQAKKANAASAASGVGPLAPIEAPPIAEIPARGTPVLDHEKQRHLKDKAKLNMKFLTSKKVKLRNKKVQDRLNAKLEARSKILERKTLLKKKVDFAAVDLKDEMELLGDSLEKEKAGTEGVAAVVEEIVEDAAVTELKDTAAKATGYKAAIDAERDKKRRQLEEKLKAKKNIAS